MPQSKPKFWVESALGQQTNKPLLVVKDANGNQTILTVGESRDLAHTLLKLAAAIEADKVLVDYMGTLGVSRDAAIEILRDCHGSKEALGKGA